MLAFLLIILARSYKTKTSRDRLKSTPYLRLKNSKKTSKVSKYSLLQYLKNPRSWTEAFIAKHPKIGRGPFGEFFSNESLTMPKQKLKGGSFGIFQHLFCHKTSKNGRGKHLWDFFRRKSLTMPKKLNRGPFSLSQYCMLRGKKWKNFFGSVRLAK